MFVQNAINLSFSVKKHTADHILPLLVAQFTCMKIIVNGFRSNKMAVKKKQDYLTRV